MKKILISSLFLYIMSAAWGQDLSLQADSLRKEGLLMPALEKYGQAFAQNQSPENSYQIASTCALLWTSQMRDTAFFFLNYALKGDSSLKALYDPSFLSLITNEKWKNIEDAQIEKYEKKNEVIRNKVFAKELFRMIIKDQGFMYVGNIERKKYMQNGGYFSTPSIFPVLAMEEKNKKENEIRLLELIKLYGWPTASSVTEYAAAGAALIINHASHELRLQYFPMLEEAFKKGEAQPLRYAKMRDRLLIEKGEKQLFGTQIKFENFEGEDFERQPYPMEEPEYVDKRRAKIGLGPLSVYLKEKFNIDWNVEQKQ